MVTVKQFRGISLAVLVLAVVLAIGSVSMARFAKATFNSNQLVSELRMTVGAFHVCIEADNVANVAFTASICGTIDKDCTTTILGYKLPPTTIGGGGQSELPDWYKEDCTKFNTFRGILVAAILLVCLSLIVATAYLIVNPVTSAKWSLGLEITYIAMVALAAIFFVVSLIAVDQTISGIPSVGFTDDQGNNLSFNVEEVDLVLPRRHRRSTRTRRTGTVGSGPLLRQAARGHCSGGCAAD